MKSPWKYLAQLTSFGRADKEPDSPRETELQSPASEAAGPVAETPNETAGDPGAAYTDAAVVAVDGGEPALVMAVDRSGADDHASRPEPARPRQAIPTRKQRRRKTSASAVAVADAIEYGDKGSGAAQPPMTFADEVAALDDEIRCLRRQLAEKLLLQNTQLKKMLERYDASQVKSHL